MILLSLSGRKAFFHSCWNVYLTCLLSAAVTYKDYHSQSGRLSCQIVLGERQVIFGEASSN